MNIIDLWPDELLNGGHVSPVELLQHQASLISQKTEKLLLGEAVILKSDREKEQSKRRYGLVIKAPGLSGYLYPLLVIRYDLHSTYPIEVEARQIFESDNDGGKVYMKWVANDQDQYEKIIGKVLNDKTTVNAVRSLLAETKAAGYDPKQIEDVPF